MVNLPLQKIKNEICRETKQEMKFLLTSLKCIFKAKKQFPRLKKEKKIEKNIGGLIY